MTKFFNIFFKKLVFGPFLTHFLIFLGKKLFLENQALSRTTSYGFLAPCQDLEKTNDTIPRERPDRRKDGETLAANIGGRGPKKGQEV